LWDVETGKEFATLKGHTGEIVSLNFNADGDKLLTGSFDRTAMVKDRFEIKQNQSRIKNCYLFA